MSREKAITLLQNSKQVNYRVCLVDKYYVRVDEKDLLLKQLLNNDDYLRVPLSLYLKNEFWRDLKAESVTSCKNKNIDLKKYQKDADKYLAERRKNNMLVFADNDGIKVNFEIIDIINCLGEEYVCILEEGTKEEDGFVILKVVYVDGNKDYRGIHDETVLDSVFDIYYERNKNNPVF